MDLLFSTTWGAIGASSVASLIFFCIQWILGTPQIRAMQERIFLTHKKVPQKVLDELVKGLNLRVVGFVHNSLQVILALTVVMDPVVWQDPLHKQTSMSQFVVVVSAGFFFWDFVVCSLEPFRDGAAFVLHGLLSFIVFGYMVASGHMHTYGCSFLLWEISTPFTQFRWIMHKMGLQDTKAFVINGLVMMFTFFGCRICWGSRITWLFFKETIRYISSGQQTISLVMIFVLWVTCLAMNTLNLVWFWKMVKTACQMLLKKPSKKDVAKEG